ncbi:MAG: Crp/Fnr family transcriptional regulator [Bryobacterales bacterium]|nr:Crp/Fnr family transcriptional regulator [Bryobacterales bacterium]
MSLPDQQTAVDIFWPGDLIECGRGRLRAVLPTECRELSPADLLNEIARQPELAAWVLRQQQQRVDWLRERILWQRRPVEQRLIHTLLELDRRAHQTLAHGAIPLTQRELAELAGATRETTSTILNRWSTQGAVELQRRRVRVLAHDRLRAMLVAEPTPAAAEDPPEASAKGAAA